MVPRPLTAVLRQISPGGIVSVEFFPLRLDNHITLGRDPVCHIVLDSRVHKGVSRQHAKLQSIPGDPVEWYVNDLESSNGTYVNGCRIKGGERLYEGDRISLGRRGPQFIFEYLEVSASSDAPDDLSSLVAHSTNSKGSVLSEVSSLSYAPLNESPSPATYNDVTFSQLFPIISTGKDLTRKAYLVPGGITVLLVVFLFLSVGHAMLFNTVLAGYLAAAAYYFVYQLCGKYKPWWLLISTGMMTAGLLMSPALNLFIWFFRGILPGDIPNPEQANASGLIPLLIQMWFGAGLMEELIKALPILCAWGIGRYGQSPYQEKWGVKEPLDGILVGTASAIGFTLIETLRLYVPDIMSDVTFQATEIESQLMGLQLLIPRILGSISGHMAYSGYLGYFIGLSALKPQHSWRIMLIGYLSASILHALWNTTGFINPLILALIGVLSYAFLAAAILKARALSPTRSENFATRFTKL